MKKKTISILCSLALLSVFGGCRQEPTVSKDSAPTETVESDTESDRISDDSVANEPTVSLEADTDNASGGDSASSDDFSDAGAGDTQVSDTRPEDAFTCSISADPSSADPQTILTWEGLTLTADYWDPETLSLHFSAENTSDTPLTIQASGCWVNNSMQSPDFSLSVEADASAQGSMTFSQDGFSESGITEAGRIGFTPVVLDGMNYSTLYTGEAVALDTGLSREASIPAGQLLAEQEGIRISFVGSSDSSLWGTDFLLCIENHSGQNLSFEAADTQVNDTAVEPLFSAAVDDGKYSVVSLSLFFDELKNKQISQIRTLSFSIRVLDPTDYHTVLTLENLSPSLS
ncbi:MAG TPA: hypothetical protein IAA57_03290 [Candidatus Pullilachnospira intestinigallinarum]|nr:hypothetical protein [Candidatus Pullilachnospira intestinigallinarum]